MSSSKLEAFDILRKTIASTKALITHFESQIQTGALPILALDSSPPNAVALFSDAGAILKAQTTKISLLVLNKPYTPSEITFILKSLCNECIPSLASACQLCPIPRYTNFLHRLIRASVGSTFKTYLGFLDDIPIDEAGEERIQRQRTLNTAGVIWDNLDSIVALGKTGINKQAELKIEDYGSLLQDAIGEIEEWLSGSVRSSDLVDKMLTPDLRDFQMRSENFFGDRGIEPDPNRGDRLASLEGNPWELPRPPTPSVKATAQKVLRLLKLVALLLPPLIKRRIKRFPAISAMTPQDAFPTEQQTEGYDHIIRGCQAFSDCADNVAEALYMHDEEGIMKDFEGLKRAARTCLSHVHLSWDGQEDEFTRWVDKWLVKLEEIGALESV